jgi:hypothetical protein
MSRIAFPFNGEKPILSHACQDGGARIDRAIQNNEERLTTNWQRYEKFVPPL